MRDAQLAPSAVCKVAFDQLNSPFNTEGAIERDKQVKMIRHDHEIMDFELAAEDVGVKDINEQHRHPFGLKKGAAANGPGSDEEGTRIGLHRIRARIS
jgi:hypothetical protein